MEEKKSKLSENELETIESETIDYYDGIAADFWNSTKEHDVSQNVEGFLKALPQGGALDILDLGCGPGRDLKSFKELGHRPIGIDGCQTFCDMAVEHSGCEALCQSFLKLDLPVGSLDGVFANATLQHVPSQELVGVLRQLHSFLRAGGILFSSCPRGDSEGWKGKRYSHFTEFETSEKFFKEAGFEILHHYYRPTGKPREEQPWLAVVCRKIGKLP